MAQPSLTLYDTPLSSYAQKARAALREKNLEFKLIAPLGLPDGEPDPEFLRANPRGEVPVLAVSGDTQSAVASYNIVDSRIIVEFLEDRFPDRPLYPKDAMLRAKARQIELVMDAQYEAINWGWGELLWMKRADGELKEHLKQEVIRQTKEIQNWLEARIEPSGWLTGPDFGIADLAAGPIVHRSGYFGFGPKPGSKLAAWLDRIEERMKVTLKEFDDNVEGIFSLSEVFLSGRRKREYRDYRLEFLVKSGGISIVQEALKNNNIRFPWPE